MSEHAGGQADRVSADARGAHTDLGRSDVPGLEAVDGDRLKALEDYLKDELAAAWSKKASLETRSLAIITAATALGTLYIAVQAQFGTPAAQMPGLSRGLLIVALVFAVLAVSSAIAASFPARYLEPSEAQMMDVFKRALEPGYLLTRLELIEAKIVQLGDVARLNDRKARLGWLAMLSLGLVTLLLLAALSWAQLSR